MINLLVLSTTGSSEPFYILCFFLGLIIIIAITAVVANTKYKNKYKVKNFEYVFKINDGYCESISLNIRSEIKILLKIWETLQNKMFQNISTESLKELFKYADNNDTKSFKPYYSNIKPKNKVVIFIENAFTEPFPSMNDNDRQNAIETEITRIFIFKGITPEQSSRFIVHTKNHFVNKTMTMGIVHFDIYRYEE